MSDVLTITEDGIEHVLICDDMGRLVCNPYDQSIVHRMARQLGISRLWFHAGPCGHYNVPRRLHNEAAAKSKAVTRLELDRIALRQHPSSMARIDRAERREIAAWLPSLLRR